jgi:hypothetical protein
VERGCGSVRGCTSGRRDPRRCAGRCTRVGSRSAARSDCGGAGADSHSESTWQPSAYGLATWRQLRELVGLAPPHHFGDVRSAPSPAPSTPVAKTRLTGTTTRQRDFEPCRASASAQPWSPSTREEVHFGVSVTGSKTTISTRTVKEWRLRWPISTSSRSRVIDLAERFADMTDAAHGKGNRVIHTQDQ